MNPYLSKHLAAARVSDLHRQAAAARRVRLARRARRAGTRQPGI